MANATPIQWTDRSLNLYLVTRLNAETEAQQRRAWHCVKVSEECAFCYAASMNRWRGNGLGYKLESSAKLVPFYARERFEPLLKSRKRWMIFPNDMTDTFLSIFQCSSCGWRKEEEERCGFRHACPECGSTRLCRFWPSDWIQDTLDQYDALATHGHVIQSLTKRPLRMLRELERWSERHEGRRLHRRVWIGFSAGNEKRLAQRWPIVRRCQSFAEGPLWLSYEPGIGPIAESATLYDALGGWRCQACGYLPGDRHILERPRTCPTCAADSGKDGEIVSTPKLAWAVAGGESGPDPNIREFDAAWAYDLISLFDEAETPLFIKQLGKKIVDTSPGAHRHWEYARVTLEAGRVRWFPLLKDKKGGDQAEWPEGLRVRQFPAEAYLPEARK